MIRNALKFLLFCTLAVIVVMFALAVYQHDITTFFTRTGKLAWVYIGVWIVMHVLAGVLGRFAGSLRKRRVKLHDAIESNEILKQQIEKHDRPLYPITCRVHVSGLSGIWTVREIKPSPRGWVYIADDQDGKKWQGFEDFLAPYKP